MVQLPRYRLNSFPSLKRCWLLGLPIYPAQSRYATLSFSTKGPLKRGGSSVDNLFSQSGDARCSPTLLNPRKWPYRPCSWAAGNPKLPLHVLSTANYPVIRFIGHIDKTINSDYFTAWKARLKLWISQGKTPFLFVHTADNREAPTWLVCSITH